MLRRICFRLHMLWSLANPNASMEGNSASSYNRINFVGTVGAHRIHAKQALKQALLRGILKGMASRCVPD